MMWLLLGRKSKSRLESSVSVSSIGIKQIEQSARSTGEVFRNIPGTKQLLESEGNANFNVHGGLYLQVDQITTIAGGWITSYAVWRYVFWQRDNFCIDSNIGELNL
jgi:hypothetical protein